MNVICEQLEGTKEGIFVDVKRFSFILASLAMLTACNSQKFALLPESQNFGQQESYNSQVDMLWVVDNSGSMSDKDQYILQQSQPFLNKLLALGMDFHMAFTTMDMRDRADTTHGRFLPLDGSGPTVLSMNTPDLLPQFISHMNVGSGGSTVSQGIAAMRAALSSDFLAHSNQGFLRDGSFLSVIFLSDEDDQSAGANDIAALDNMRPPRPSGEKGWMADFIGVLQSDSTSTGCTSNPRGYVDPGLKYISLAQISGGVTQSICSGDFSRMLENIRAAIVEVITEYNLAREPDVSTIVVLVNGQVVPQDPVNGWTYSPQGYTIKFHGTSVPPVHASIKVNYQPLRPT